MTSPTVRVVSIASNHQAFAALHEDGTVSVWGKYEYGGHHHNMPPKATQHGAAEVELYSAAYHGNAQSIKKLLRGGADKHWRHPTGGATALYVACEFGHADAAKLLLEAKARPDEARDDGATPLVKACQDGGRMDIARLLVGAGAEVNKEDKMGMTPLLDNFAHLGGFATPLA